MDDEATTHYNAIIDEHSLGLEFLRQNFGDCSRPRVAWQIDPFGHSREQASLFAHMGYDGLFFGRVDFEDKFHRELTKSMEMVWQGSPSNLGPSSDLFSGVLYHGYNPPPGFCWDTLCSDDPIMDDKNMEDYNADLVTQKFLNYTKYQALAYATEHIMMTMGSDFNYQNAHMWFKNMDKLINLVNAQQKNGSKVNLLYSTPSCYLYQVNLANKTWPTKKDDFFPYAHLPHSYWTGFYTSRPNLKRYVRQTNNFLQVCKQLDALAMLEDSDNSSLNIQVLKEAMGVAQHHDAVSGTEKQAVANDYAKRLARGTLECQKVVNDAYKKLFPKQKEVPPDQMFCSLLNISMCQATENNKQFTMTVYNPIGRSVGHWIRLPVIGKSYVITDPNGKSVPSQVLPISNETKKIPERKGSLAENELVFWVMVPPLGFNTFFIKQSSGPSKTQKSVVRQLDNADIVIKNQHLSLMFDGNSGQLKSMKNLNSGASIPLQQTFQFYIGHPGNTTVFEYQASGAYVFRPLTSAPADFQPLLKKRTFHVQGQLVQEIRQWFSPWVSQVVRLYDQANYAELEWTVGPIPVSDGLGKEVITKYSTGLQTNGVFYTDANGREILKRTRNHRDTWKFKTSEPIAANYYPINSRVYIKDSNSQFTVMTDRSQGGTSLQDGNLEVMLHRRLLYDDNLGVGEALNETGADGKGLIARGKHFLFLDTVQNSGALHRDMGLRLYMAPSLSFTNSQMKQQEWSQKFYTAWSGLKTSLPDNVHMLTLEQWGGPTIKPSPTQPFLVRFEHIYEKGENSELSKPVKLMLKDIFVPFRIKTMVELTLGANLPLSDLKRLQWKTTDYTTDAQLIRHKVGVADNFTVILNPMEIRTFQVTLA
ncbi:lysosomal alpha-mannosidase-like isoform X2 [Ostrea edulis]|nr:lysosomal alpha-mannosidase-like isoform X2 [Ostrea edulis]